MSDFPPVVVLLITYERTDVALATIRGVKEKIHYPNLSWHIADDGSNGHHVASLMSEIGPEYEVTVSNTGGHSVGKSMNLGIEEVLKRADMWLHWEDDWVPNMHIDLSPCVHLLLNHENVGMIRLGRLQNDLHAKVVLGGDRFWWLLDKSKHEWCWTGHAAMRHRRFHDAYGKYEEGLTPGKTEMAMLNSFNTKKGPGIVWPAWLTYDICDHIGDGYSFKEAMENRKLTKEEANAEFTEKMNQAKVVA